MTAYHFVIVLGVSLLGLLLASIVVPWARVACGVLCLGVAVTGVVRAGDMRSISLFAAIGVAELVWGHLTTTTSRTSRTRTAA